LKQEFIVLKTLIEATGHMDLKGFADKVNLSPNQALHQIQELAKDGFLQRVGAGYGVTQKGKAALKAFKPVAKDNEFRFYYGLDNSSDHAAESLAQFYSAIKQVRVDSLEFHLYRSDFQNWLRDVCKEPDVADEFDRVAVSGLKGEALRAELTKTLDAKYGVSELISVFSG